VGQPDSSSSSPLEYAPAAPVLRRRRVRRVIYALMAAVVGVVLWRAGPPFARQVRYVYWQRQCMTFSAPADFVAYEEDPTRAAALLKQSRYRTQALPATSGTAAGFSPPPLAHLESVWGWGNVLYMHAATTSLERRRLIVVDLAVRRAWGTSRTEERVIELYGAGLVPASLRPGTETEGTGGNYLDLILQQTDRLRVFWGQPDPIRSDRFTIGYELNGEPGAIEGLLKDDGQVDLRVLDGPATKVAQVRMFEKS
jgi:hypothetical protein